MQSSKRTWDATSGGIQSSTATPESKKKQTLPAKEFCIFPSLGPALQLPSSAPTDSLPPFPPSSIRAAETAISRSSADQGAPFGAPLAEIIDGLSAMASPRASSPNEASSCSGFSSLPHRPPKVTTAIGVSTKSPKTTQFTRTGTNTKAMKKRSHLSLNISAIDNEPQLVHTRPSKKADPKKACSKITNFLYVGGVDVAMDRDSLKSCGITHVINMCGKSAKNFFPAELQYYRVPLRDHTTADISALFFSLIFLIERARIEGGIVLIHCVKGISRSPAVAIAYLMWSKQWSLNESFRFLKECRPICCPNSGFQLQLHEWGDHLHHNANPVLYRVSAPPSMQGYSFLPVIEGPFAEDEDFQLPAKDHSSSSKSSCFIRPCNSLSEVVATSDLPENDKASIKAFFNPYFDMLDKILFRVNDGSLVPTRST